MGFSLVLSSEFVRLASGFLDSQVWISTNFKQVFSVSGSGSRVQ